MRARWGWRGTPAALGNGAPEQEEARHLDEWAEQDWQTEHGDGRARHGDGTTGRYQPRAAYTEAKKRVLHELEHGDGRHDEPTRQELYEEAKRRGIPGRSRRSKGELAEAVGHKRVVPTVT